MKKLIPSTSQILHVPFFLLSFSAEDDLLSQWTAYRDEHGCLAIGFSREGIEAMLSPAPLIPCYYRRCCPSCLANSGLGDRR